MFCACQVVTFTQRDHHRRYRALGSRMKAVARQGRLAFACGRPSAPPGPQHDRTERGSTRSSSERHKTNRAEPPPSAERRGWPGSAHSGVRTPGPSGRRPSESGERNGRQHPTSDPPALAGEPINVLVESRATRRDPGRPSVWSYVPPGCSSVASSPKRRTGRSADRARTSLCKPIPPSTAAR
jgi:hypothetical protein